MFKKIFVSLIIFFCFSSNNIQSAARGVYDAGRGLIASYRKDQRGITQQIEEIASIADINEQDKSGNTLLILACVDDNYELVKKLLELDANLGIKNKYGQNFFDFLSDKEKSIAIKHYCAQKNEYINKIKDNQQEFEELQKQYSEMILDLIIQDFNVKVFISYLDGCFGELCRGFYHKQLPLVLKECIKSDNKKRLNFILRHNSDYVNCQIDSGKTMLMQACEDNNIGMINILLDHKASVNILDENGKIVMSALEVAKEKGFEEIVNILTGKATRNNKRKLEVSKNVIEKVKKNITEKAKKLKTESDLESAKEGGERKVQADLENTKEAGERKVEVEYSDERKPLQQKRKPKEYEVLDKEKARIKKENFSKLITATQHNNLKYIKAVIDADKSYINMRDLDGFSLLYFAVFNYKNGIVKYLLDNGADPNLCNYTTDGGFSPLRVAISKGNLEALKMLVESGKVDLKTEGPDLAVSLDNYRKKCNEGRDKTLYNLEIYNKMFEYLEI